MAKKTIQNKWAQNSSNVQTFTEDEIASGIEYKGAVVSNQLNGIGKNIYEYTDNLQRAGTAWNPLKSYEIGDVVVIRVNLNGKLLYAKFACIVAGVSAPLVDKGATSFILDDSKNVCVFTITDGGAKDLREYCGDSWTMLESAASNGSVKGIRFVSVESEETGALFTSTATSAQEFFGINPAKYFTNPYAQTHNCIVLDFQFLPTQMSATATSAKSASAQASATKENTITAPATATATATARSTAAAVASAVLNYNANKCNASGFPRGRGSSSGSGRGSNDGGNNSSSSSSGSGSGTSSVSGVYSAFCVCDYTHSYTYSYTYTNRPFLSSTTASVTATATATATSPYATCGISVEFLQKDDIATGSRTDNFNADGTAGTNVKGELVASSNDGYRQAKFVYGKPLICVISRENCETSTISVGGKFKFNMVIWDK